jgi:hypothetical protein
MIRRIEVKLSPEQVAFATKIGRKRHELHNSTGRVDPLVDTSRTGLDVDVQGACAEMAVSVALKRPWDGAFQKLEDWRIWRKIGHDVSGLQVRCTNYATGGLCIHESDPNDHPFLLVIDRDAPTYIIAGWIFGRDAKKPAYWNTTEMAARPCFLVPQADLTSCVDLMREDRPSGGRTRDPAPDFAGHGRWPQRRYADDGSHPSTYGNIIPSSWDVPCLRCQTLIKKGEPVGGNLVTGTIHGDPNMCKMKKRR